MPNISDVAADACSAVVFYGIAAGKTQAKDYYRLIVEWFTDLGFPPDKLSVHGTGHSKGLSSFSRSDLKIRRNDFKDVTYFELVSSTPNARTGHDYFLEASYRCDAGDAYVNVIARSSLATLTSSSLLPIARRIVQLLMPAYGIGFTRDHSLGPELYAIGVNFGNDATSGPAYEQKVLISRWCDTGMVEQVWRDGVLRDVYPWNFLTEPQLNRLIDGVRLEEWIRADIARGTINHLSASVSHWELKDKQIPGVRSALERAGAIFDWRKYA
jgi:hypothetical protein